MSDSREVVAIYGGSFNPPHVGHALVAQWVLWTGHAQRLWLLPVYQHAFEGRHGKVLAPYDQRVRWCRALAEDIGPQVSVSTVESTLPPPSYTVQTLEHLAAQHPDIRFRLIIGADALPQLPDWHRWPHIAEHFDPIIVGRQGYPPPEGSRTVDFPNVSSTEIRRKHAAGASVRHLLTGRVADLMDQSETGGK